MFGKTQRGVSERPNKPKKPLIPAWLGTLVVILIILSFAVALILWKPWEPVQPRDPSGAPQTTEETNQDYRFYDLLPQQQVTPIPEQAVPESKEQAPIVIIQAPESTTTMTEEQAGTITSTESVAPKTTYILQVRSYTDPDAADARRAEIILNGLSADVIRTTERGETWYRVVSGPYESQESAVIAQQTLQHSGIDSIVIKR